MSQKGLKNEMNKLLFLAFLAAIKIESTTAMWIIGMAFLTKIVVELIAEGE